MSSLISFTITAPRPHNHLFEVEMHLRGLGDVPEVLLRMPVWTPGSYLVREYSRHIQELEVFDGDGERRRAQKVDKASWRVDASSCGELRVCYKVYAHDLTVRTNHLDGSHGFFNCVATCLYPQGRLKESVELRVLPPEGWEVFCGLERLEGPVPTYVAEDYDELFDTAVELGPHPYFDFDVKGVPHRAVFWGESNLDMEALERDLPKVVAENARLFGEIPYERYVFINHLVDGAFGGLEHRHSSVNIYDARSLDPKNRGDGDDYGKGYRDFLRLLCHEHFHAYNVKRLRPRELGPFDYQQENYTRALWVVEGVTCYYDTYNLCQAGLITPGRYLKLLEGQIRRLMRVPGRRVHSLEEASFDAWIKLYRPDENTRNSSVSYYLKGELVVWLLDLWIRDQSDGERTMADVMRKLWADYHVAEDVGFEPGAVEAVVRQVSGADPGDFFHRFIRGTEEIPWEEFLTPLGLQLEPEGGDGESWLGLETRLDDRQAREVSFIYRDSPAEAAGIYAGDELVGIDGWSVRGQKVDKLLREKAPGEVSHFHLIRRGRLMEVEATHVEAPPRSYRLRRREDASERALLLLEGWLGTREWTN